MQSSKVSFFKSMALASAFALTLGGCASTMTHESAQIHHPAHRSGKVLEQWGVEVLGVSVTAAGYFLDMRYRVLDADKAQHLSDSKKDAYVIDPLTNKRQSVADTPTAGQLRERGRKLVLGRVYSIIFTNPGKRIAPGMKVNLVVGDLRLDNVEVQ